MNALYAIPLTSRWEGMIVYVVNEQAHYTLIGGVDSAFWRMFEGGDSTGSADDTIITYGASVQSGNDLLLNDEWQWRIDGVIYTGTDDTITIAPAASGNIRTDVIVGDNTGAYILVAGNEVAAPGPVTPPNIPVNTVPLIEILVSDTGISSFADFADGRYVSFVIAQNLTEPQKLQAQENMGVTVPEIRDGLEALPDVEQFNVNFARGGRAFNDDVDFYQDGTVLEKGLNVPLYRINADGIANLSGNLIIVPDIAGLQTVVRGNNRFVAFVREEGRSGLFDYVESVDFVGSPDNGISFLAQDGGYWVRRFSGPIDVEWFREDSNDHTTLQNAFDFIESTKSGYNQYIFKIPSKRAYNIAQPLLLNTFADVKIIGDGLRNSVINATAVMDAMIVLGTGVLTPFVGRIEVSGMTFNGGGLADCCVDARGTRYSVFQKNEFTGLAANGEALRLDGWVQKVQENIFSNIAGTLGLTAIRNYSEGVSNNVSFLKNSISSYLIGLRTDNISNSVNIWGNSFDNCDGAGIYISAGARGTSIENNYFEACGDTGLTITKGAPGSTQEVWKGAIVGHHNYLSSNNWINGLIIKNNQFANCSDVNNGLITLSGVDYGVIEENFTYLGYSNKYFVDLRWEGSRLNTNRYVKIDHSESFTGQFEELVGLNADVYNNGHNNLIIIDHKAVSYAVDYSKPIFNNFLLWNTGTAWRDVHEDDETYRDNRVLNYRGNSNNALRSITLTADSNLKGQYFRVNWFQYSDVSATCTFTFKVDAVTVNTFSVTSDTSTWSTGGRNGIIYIPESATNITFEFAAISPSTARKIAGFSITPAHYPLNESVTLRPTRLTSENYITGGTPEGFQKAKAGRLCIDLFNGKTYKKITDYDTLTGWQEIVSNSVSAEGAGLTSSDGVNLTGTFKNGAIVTSSVSSGNVGYPSDVSFGQVVTFNGPNLDRTWSILKDRDSDKAYIQDYNGSGVGQGWKKFLMGIGAGLTGSDGTNLTGSPVNGDIVTNAVSASDPSYPSGITNAQVITFNGVSLQRSWSILKDRDSKALYTQYYNATGVGQGWKNISGFELDANGNAVIDNTKKVGNGTANSNNWTQYGNGANIYNVPTGQQHLFYQNGAIVAGINGDGKFYLDGAGDGIILKSPDGTQYELTVPNGGGSVTITAV